MQTTVFQNIFNFLFEAADAGNHHRSQEHWNWSWAKYPRSCALAVNIMYIICFQLEYGMYKERRGKKNIIMQAIFKTLRICNTLNLILYDWGLWSGVLHIPHLSCSSNSQGVPSSYINSKQNVLCYEKYILKCKFQVLMPNFVNLKGQEKTFALPCGDKYLVLATQKGIFKDLSLSVINYHQQLPSD